MPDDRKTAKPLTTADLYGVSGQEHALPEIPAEGAEAPQEVKGSEVPRDASGNLVYEETPIIEPVEHPEKPPDNREILADYTRTSEQQKVHEVPENGREPISEIAPGKPGRMRGLFLFLIVFLLGIGASVLYRNFINSVSQEPEPAETSVTLTPTPPGEQPEVTPAVPDSQPVVPEWSKYNVWQGQAKTAVSGVSYLLPPVMREPVCDGTGCVSAGTYMPGGTRFTVASYKRNILTPRFSETQVTDAAGRKFQVREATVSGKPALLFTGDFTGSTTGGYRFTRMSGVMIAAGPETTIEVNHFSPAGVSTEFDNDEDLFTEILRTFSFE